MTSAKAQRYFVVALGLIAMLTSVVADADGIVHFLTTNWQVILEHTLVGVMFALTGAFVRNMCEHLWHKLLLGGFLVIAESIFTVAVVG